MWAAECVIFHFLIEWIKEQSNANFYCCNEFHEACRLQHDEVFDTLSSNYHYHYHYHYASHWWLTCKHVLLHYIVMKQPAVCIIGACAVLAHFKLKWLSLHYHHGFECVYDEARSTVDIGRFVFSLLQPRGWYESPPTIALYTAATSLTSQPASRPAVQWWHDHGQSLSCLFEDPPFLLILTVSEPASESHDHTTWKMKWKWCSEL